MSTYDVTDFTSDVLDRSFEHPVLVDFWAEWCGPCRILGPVLERMARHADGRWELRKLNTEEFPDISVQYGIRSIPNVKLFSKGQPIDEFAGALPEPAIRMWLDKALPDPNDEFLNNAEALLLAGEQEAAGNEAMKVLAVAPDHERARTLAAVAILFRDPDRAHRLVEDLDEGSKHWELAGSVQEISRLISKETTGDALEEKPVKQLYRKAVDALARRDFDSALATFIEVIREDRSYDNDGSRKACIAIFKYLGEQHEITQKHRRDFGSALYL
jgi:putative thioredoxin